MRVEGRSRGAVALFLIAAVALFAAYPLPRLWGGLTFALAALGAWEWGRLCGFAFAARLLHVAAFVVFALAGLVALQFIAPSALFGAITFFWALAAPWWILRGQRPSPILTGAAGHILLFGVWQAAAQLYEADSIMLFAGIGLACVFDSVCYFVGRAVGRTPLSRTASPKKTVEGLLGGVTAALAAGMLYGEYFVIGVSRPALLCAAFSLAALALVGDLFVSAMKRRAGVKDSGEVFGNHGGVLDRLDSLLPVLPMMALLSPWVT